MNRQRRIATIVLAAAALLPAACASDGPPTIAQRSGASISCDDLANYIVANETFANRQEMDPLIAELIRCSALTPDQARTLLDEFLSSRAEIDATLAAVG